jgi:hypothetical protein
VTDVFKEIVNDPEARAAFAAARVSFFAGVLLAEDAAEEAVKPLVALYPDVPKSMLKWVVKGDCPLANVLVFARVLMLHTPEEINAQQERARADFARRVQGDGGVAE